MGAKQPQPHCPVCRTGRVLTLHCGSPTCGWHHCRGCKVTVDLPTRRGYSKAGQPVTWQAKA